MESGINRNAASKIESALNDYTTSLKKVVISEGYTQTQKSAVVGQHASMALLKYNAELHRTINSYIDELYKPLTGVINTARSNYSASDEASTSLNNSWKKLKS